MIKEIIFQSTKDFNKKYSVKFNKHINVIVGPKGGGKSTLFDLVAGLKNNYIYDNVNKALAEYGWEFDSAYLFSGEKILSNQLQKMSVKEREQDYEKRNDVIYQNDPIKTDLTSSKKIDNDKFNYVLKQVNSSKNVDNFLKQINDLYNSMLIVNNYNNSSCVNINWTNAFSVQKSNSDDKLSLITKLNVNNINLTNDLLNEEEKWKKLLVLNSEYINNLKKVQYFQQNEILQNHEFNQQIVKSIDLIDEQNKKIETLIKRRIEQLNVIKIAISSFDFAHKKIVEKIKNESSLLTTIKVYESNAKDHFKNIASNVFDLRETFENLLSKKIMINVENDRMQNSSLIFDIQENIEFAKDDVVEILKVVFYTPGSSVEDVTKWLKSLVERGIKEYDDKRIKTQIAKKIKLSTRVLVDNKDYESLSLGQRSIYGLKYKFNNSFNNDLFLDQPEDNLDNETIAKDVLDMIEQKKDQQVFIVTHNANIGILSNPENVIIADLLNKEEPYEALSLENSNLPANYLEGGKLFLEKRYKKIILEEMK